MIRVILPGHLRTLAHVSAEVQVHVKPDGGIGDADVAGDIGATHQD